MASKHKPSPRAVAFKAWMAAAGTNTKRVAELTDVPYTTLATFVQGGTRSLKGDTEAKVAAALGFSVDQIFNGATAASSATPASKPSAVGEALDLASIRDFVTQFESAPKTAGRARQITRSVPVVGEVAAGRWLEAAALSANEITEFLHIDVQGYERAVLRAWRVVGPSMNLVYPEGRYVITAHPAEAGVRNGDYVIVQRHRGDLVEITLKEIVGEPDGRIALWPRSNHPDFQSPIYLRNDDMDQTAPEIVGVVVADYSTRVRPPSAYGTF